MNRENAGGPGPRKEIGGAESSQAHPPHVTENDEGAPVQASTQAPNDVPALPANAHGRDQLGNERSGPGRIDPESMYDHRPGEDKDRRETDST
ncbi:MAG TPA: hypothetical protein VFQ45_21360 [Longimicrobium sp.]|nr:hypothetical protein [Longimicrobium sp.]